MSEAGGKDAAFMQEAREKRLQFVSKEKKREASLASTLRKRERESFQLSPEHPEEREGEKGAHRRGPLPACGG